MVNTHEAKTQLSKLLLRVQAGDEIVIANRGRPIAKLVPYREREGPRLPGSAKGQILWISDDFDAPMPEDFMRYFE